MQGASKDVSFYLWVTVCCSSTSGQLVDIMCHLLSVDFLEEIRMRGQTGLKSVNDPDNIRKMSEERQVKEDNSLAGLLITGLENIKRGNQGSDSCSDSESESEDSWSEEE